MSSHPIPGNEEMVYRTINKLFQRGANVIYEAIAPVHVSGHASQEEIKLLIHLTRPKYVIPVHGELRQLHQHAALARQVGIPAENIAVIENGQVIEFENGKMTLAERVPGKYVFVDGAGVGDVNPGVMREREMLSRDGIIMVNLALDTKGCLMKEADVMTRGFMTANDCEELVSGIKRRVGDTVSRANGNLQGDVEQSVRSFLYNETKRRPMVFVSVHRT
jgi:ribonuclease J